MAASVLSLFALVLVVHHSYALSYSDPYAQVLLRRQNEHRDEWNAPPLTYDNQIAQVAQNWANTLDRENAFRHSGDDRYSESILKGSGRIPAKMAVDAWYSESSKYINGEREYYPIGHFVNMVDVNSRRMGCGQSGGIVVCNYYPPAAYEEDDPSTWPRQ